MIYRHGERHNLKYKYGVKHPGYKGGFITNGYRVISVKSRRIFEHRYIMEQHLGRILSNTELIHRINGNRLDNRIENLELVDRSQHKKMHPDIGKDTTFKQRYYLVGNDIVGMYLRKKSLQKVADTFGCSEITIRRLIRGTTSHSATQLKNLAPRRLIYDL